MWLTILIAVPMISTVCLLGLLAIEESMAIDPFEDMEEKPLRNHRSGNITLDRGYEICRFAAWHREQMEGELAELCQMFGVDINQDCTIRDWCIEVIYDGTLSLDDCIDKVAELQRELKKQTKYNWKEKA